MSPSVRTRRPDLLDFNMQTTVQLSALRFDQQTSTHSGWIYLAAPSKTTTAVIAGEIPRRDCLLRKRRPVFQRRFMRLHGLVCSLYVDDTDSESPPLETLVIRLVERAAIVNKGITITDCDGRRLLLHTVLAADFDRWFDVFVSVVRTSHIAKLQAAKPPQQAPVLANQVSVTESLMLTRESFNSTSSRDIDSQHLDTVARTYTTWLNVHLRRRKIRRRYIVLSGACISLFSWNREGRLAESSRFVKGFRYDAELDPLSVDVSFTDGSSVRMSTPTRQDVVEAWIEQLRMALNMFET